jgi:hypothetical protein
MNLNRLSFALIICCFCLSSFSKIEAQQIPELPEIKGSHSQVYKDVKIEIVDLKRVTEFQDHWPNSDHPRFPKVIAEPGEEIVIIHIHSERLASNPGIRVSELILYDAQGEEYESSMHSFFIGTGSESRFDPPTHEYELPVIVPTGKRFSAVQLRQHIYRNESPQQLVQKITFELSFQF